MKPRLLLLTVLVLVTTLVVPIGGAAGPTADGRFEVVTKRFANAEAITIPMSGTASPYPAKIRVRGLTRGRLLDVNLTLRGFTHEIVEDVDILLVAPNGRNAIVMSDIGGVVDPPGITVTLDDEASDPLPANGPLVNGSFRPYNDDGGDDATETFSPAPAPSGAVALSTFDGINPNGTWSLFVMDDFNSGEGRIANGWQLTIKARVRR